MKLIKLTKGFVTKVDDEDFEWLNQWKWSASKSAYDWYAVRRSGNKRIYMHRQIMNAQNGEQVHHLKHTLDNRKSMLEVCTQHKNLIYRKKSCVTRSQGNSC